MTRDGLGDIWRRSSGLRREIALVMLVKTLLLILLVNIVSTPAEQRRVGPFGTSLHLLEAVPIQAAEGSSHER